MDGGSGGGGGVVTAETAGAPEACRTLLGPSLVPATFLLFDLGSGTSSSCSSVEDLRLLLRLVCDGLSLLLAGTASVSPVLSLSVVNDRYKECSVHFVIVDSDDLEITSSPPPPRNWYMIFHEYEGVWSVAAVSGALNMFGLFSGLGDKKHLDIRLGVLAHVLRDEICLPALKIDFKRLDKFYSDEFVLEHKEWSGPMCLAWAEAVAIRYQGTYDISGPGPLWEEVEFPDDKGGFGSGMAVGTWEKEKMREVARIMWRRARSASFLALPAL